MIEKVFKCDCHDPEHQVWFSYDSDDDDKEMYVTYHIESRSLLRRLKHSIKYVFGFRSYFGAFSEIILTDNKVTELEVFIKEFRNAKQL